ncbi:MAG: glycoside hydrolase family 20 zincin-like fold domain-containing protein [Gemmatimonadota bacterium]|nr:glycoside hydrolase family 20 zincin-like fold domain-containing protein [Gemmatimonadota bacterium]
MFRIMCFQLCLAFLAAWHPLPAWQGTVPSAKSEEFGAGTFRLAEAVISAGGTGREREIARLLMDELNRRNPGAGVSVGGDGNIRLVLGHGPEPGKDFQEREAYSLEITGTGATVKANYTEGLLWGAVTLIQLSENGELPESKIEDYPAMEFRAIHLNLRDPNRDRNLNRVIGKVPVSYYGKSIMYSLGWLKNFVRECALLKINRIVFECDDKVQWTATPDKRHEGSLTPEQVKEWCAYASLYGIEICPMVNAPGHAQWYTSHNREGYGGMDEAGRKAYRVDVESEKVQRDFCSIMEDECAWFNSDYVHIAADETEKAETFLRKIVDVARKNGKKIIAWEGPSNDMVSRWGGIVMLWNYGDGYRAVGPGRLCAGGIWSNGQRQAIMGYADQSFNPYGWGRGVVEGGGLGMLTTIWTNYPGPSFEGLWEQIHMAGQASWGPNSKPADYGRRFARQFFGIDNPTIYDAYKKLYGMKKAGLHHCFYLRAEDVSRDTADPEERNFFDAGKHLSQAKVLQAAVEPLGCRCNRQALDFLAWQGRFMEFHASTVLAFRGDKAAAQRAAELGPEIREGFMTVWGYGMTGRYVIESWQQVIDSRLKEIISRQQGR